MRHLERYRQAAINRWKNKTPEQIVLIGARISASKKGKQSNVDPEARIQRDQKISRTKREAWVNKSIEEKEEAVRINRESHWREGSFIPVVRPYLAAGLSVRQIADNTSLNPRQIYRVKTALKHAGIVFFKKPSCEGLKERERRKLYALAKEVPVARGLLTIPQVYERDGRPLPKGITMSGAELYYAARLNSLKPGADSSTTVTIEDFEKIFGKVEHINPRIKLKDEMVYIDKYLLQLEREKKAAMLLQRRGSVLEVAEFIGSDAKDIRAKSASLYLALPRPVDDYSESAQKVIRYIDKLSLTTQDKRVFFSYWAHCTIGGIDPETTANALGMSVEEFEKDMQRIRAIDGDSEKWAMLTQTVDLLSDDKSKAFKLLRDKNSKPPPKGVVYKAS